MKKGRITFEEFALMSFLKFDRLDGMDMTVLREMTGNNFELVIDDTSDNYFITTDGTIVLNDSYVDNFCKYINYDIMEKIEKTKFYKQIDEINVFEFNCFIISKI